MFCDYGVRTGRGNELLDMHTVKLLAIGVVLWVELTFQTFKH